VFQGKTLIVLTSIKTIHTMNYTVKNKHIVTLLAAIAGMSSASVFAAPAPGLVENPQVGVVYVSANDITNVPNAQIRFGQNSTTGGGGAAVNNTTIASLATADITKNLVFTPLNNVAPSLTSETKGGLLIDPTTGNTTVKQGSTSIDSILPGLVRVREQEVYSNDPSVPAALRGTATATPAVTRYGTLVGSTFTPITGLSGATVTAIETFVDAPTADNAKALMDSIKSTRNDSDLLKYTLGLPAPTANTGNFTVEGVTGTNGIANTGNISTNSLNVSGTSTLATANITTANVTSANVTGLTVTGAAAFDSRPTVGSTVAIPTSQSVVAPTVGAQVAGYTAPVANTTNRVALTADVLSEAQARASADSQLQANINSETAARIVDVNAEEDRARAAETALAGRATALEGRATALEGRTTALEGRVGRAEGRINSLRKGVSMAAALQTPVIEAGKQNAVKAGVATVDGAQGFGIAVARRINDSVQVNLDVATDFETDTAARAGVNYSF